MEREAEAYRDAVKARDDALNRLNAAYTAQRAAEKAYSEASTRCGDARVALLKAATGKIDA